MLGLVKDHREENRSFRSDDNLNFDTVKDELTNFKDVKLEKFNSYVMQNGISKDRPQVIKKIEYLTDKNTVDYKKKIAQSNITKDALKMYDPKIAAIAFVPSIDNTNSYYMSRTKTGIDDLAKSSYDAGMEASKISKKLDGYKKQNTSLSKSEGISEKTLEYTDTYLNEIVQNFKELAQKIYNLDNEYLKYKTENYFSYKIADRSKVLNFSVIIKFAVFGFVFAFLIILYMEFAHSYIYKKTKSAKKAIKVISKINSRED